VDPLNFALEMTKALAWPIATAGMLFMLRKPILSGFGKISKLKLKDVELEFGRELEQAKAEVAGIPAQLPLPLPTRAPSNSRILGLAETSPRAAIIEAWLDVEKELLAAAERADVWDTPRGRRSATLALRALEQSDNLHQGLRRLLHHLKRLRNDAAHSSEFKPSVGDALEYARLSEEATRMLKALVRDEATLVSRQQTLF